MPVKKACVNDFLIFEEFCNMSCAYCEGFYGTGLKLKRKGSKLVLPDAIKKKINDDPVLMLTIGDEPNVRDVFRVSQGVLHAIDLEFKPDVLKISGGEIFIVPEMVGFIEDVSRDYSSVQILTNGSLLDRKKLRKIADIGNVSFQVSLDGATFETNAARARSKAMHERVMEAIGSIRDYGFPLEINCVLTKHNTGRFGETVEYFSGFEKTKIYPRPVRGKPRDVLFPEREQSLEFERYCERTESHVLPPKPYLKRVSTVLSGGCRQWPCYVPEFVLGTDCYGRVKSCTGIEDHNDIGAVFSWKFDLRNKAPVCAPFTGICGECINQYEMYNLFVDGEITASTLKAEGFFPTAIETAAGIKAELKKCGY